MPNVICTARHNAKHFNWTDANKIPSVDMSTMCGPLRDGVALWSQIYDDAADVGFVLINEDKSTEAVFYLSRRVMYGEEVGGWEFKPTPETLRKYPKLAGFVLTVFND